MTALRVLIDGTPLADDEGRAFWKRYADWMEAHRGDLGGFAQAEGLASVHPELRGGGPVLVASRTEPQRPYGVAPARDAQGRAPAGGPPARRAAAPASPPGGKRRRNKGPKR
ncbi:MAG TPA: hypothetical protein VN894_12075 [Polyangiaceae bacterium]|nr:hypothetical protein [Polyangiaceae bacterium]